MLWCSRLFPVLQRPICSTPFDGTGRSIPTPEQTSPGERTPVYSVQCTVDIVSSAYSWPGVGKPLDQYGPPGKPAADDNDDDDDDDDDVDLFGSDDEDAVSLMRMEF